MKKENLRWMRLDNAAKIFPASLRKNWSNAFRVSATLTEDVDVAVLQSALDVTVHRFPSIAARLRRGVFWYYLQQISQAPQIQEEHSYPLARMSRQELRACAFRVIVYQRRIAVELFHSLTDGNGGMVFLKSLLAEYFLQKYGISAPAEKGVLDRLEEPKAEELEDSFLRYAGSNPASRNETTAWYVPGTPEPTDFTHLTCLQLPVDKLLETAHEYGVSLTAFLASAMLMALQNLQKEEIPDPRKRKLLKVQIPVNLRQLFPSKTLRNFALFTIPEIDPRLGEYSFQEICRLVHHHVGIDVTAKQMSRRIAANVGPERSFAIRLLPLFLKNPILKIAFNLAGERLSCITMSNLGAVQLPEEMMPFVERMEFTLSVPATRAHHCGITSFKSTVYVNMVRNIRESGLEYHFFCVLRDLGIPVEVQSNSPER